MFLDVSLELFRGQVNVSIFGNIKLIIENAFKVVLFVQKAGLCYLNERIAIFNAKENVFETDFIVLVDGSVLLSILFDGGIALNAGYEDIDDLLSREV